MRALRIKSRANASVEDNVPIPTLRPGHILVKVVAAALNPTDYKHIASTNSPVSVGCDYAGVVVDVATSPPEAEAATASTTSIIKTWRKGDRVCGVIHGANTSHPEDGTFAEYVLAMGDLQIKIPEDMSYEDAASLGMGVSTVGQGFQSLGLPMPGTKTDGGKILVYGGSSAMGVYGIQFFKTQVSINLN
jgi:NADPH:quinone reductase-like Zn-dependent oxidoreductase